MTVTMQDKGCEVVTEDGAVVGTVKEVVGSYFKVDAPMKRDFWLESGLVCDREADRVLLEVSKADLAERERSEPGLEPEEDPMARIIGDPVISEEELLKQRATMEIELAEQVEALPSHETSVTHQPGERPYEKIPEDHTGFREHAGLYVPNHAAIRHEELQSNARSGRTRKKVAIGAIVLLAAGAAAMAVMRRRANSIEKQPIERGKQLLRRAYLGVRGLRM